MGFKADLSFLEKLTMGAAGTRAVIESLQEKGLEPIELERYSTSNKIWTTKVKRLRLPDILCVRTGIRVEARAKSDLKIKMSDSPSVPERRWDAGARDEDLVALLACQTTAHGVTARGEPVLFTFGDLRAAVATSVLGPPKSASEGAERDRTWPCIVPSADGVVEAVTAEKLVVRMDAGRRQTYTLKGKTPYVAVGDRFLGEASILAGTVPRMAKIADLLSRTWDPRADLVSPDAARRYAAAKAIPHRQLPEVEARSLLEKALLAEKEPRVALEVAGAAARLGSAAGYDYLARAARGDVSGLSEEFRMEAVLILTEIASPLAGEALREAARSRHSEGMEIRQAAVWGLGRRGARQYGDLVPFLDDEDDVSLHAIAAFGDDTPEGVIRELVAVLTNGTSRTKPAASEALRLIGTRTVARELLAAYASSKDPWILASLGRLPGEVLGDTVTDPIIRNALAPVAVLVSSDNWLARSRTAGDLQFLLGQNL